MNFLFDKNNFKAKNQFTLNHQGVPQIKTF